MKVRVVTMRSPRLPGSFTAFYTVAVLEHLDHQVTKLVGPQDPHACLPEHGEGSPARVSEVVSLPHADAGHLRRPGGESLRYESVRTAVMRHLEHLDLGQGTVRKQTLLNVSFRITGEHHLELACVHQ